MCRTKSKTKTKTPSRSSALDDTSRQGSFRLWRQAFSKPDRRPVPPTEARRMSPGTAKGAIIDHPQDTFLKGIAVNEDTCSDMITTQSIKSTYSGAQEPRPTESNGQNRFFKGSSSLTQPSLEITSTAQTPRVGQATARPLIFNPSLGGHTASSLQSLDTYRRGDGLQDTPWDQTVPSDGNTYIREQGLQRGTSLPIAVSADGMVTEDAFLEPSRAALSTDLPFRYTLLSGEGHDGSLSTDLLAEDVDDLLRLDVPYWTEDQESGRFYHWDAVRQLMTWYPDEFD